MKHITNIHINTQLYNKITEFYFNAKLRKYKHSYGWDEVFKDIQLSSQDKNLTPTNKTKQDWLSAVYNVARNKRGWAFAYITKDDTMYIYDAENCRNLTVDYQNTALFTMSTQKVNQQCKIAGDAGYGYKIVQSTTDNRCTILTPQGELLTKFVFDHIIGFHHSSNDYNTIYAIGFQKDRVFAIYQDGNIKVLPYSKEEYLNKTHKYYESHKRHKKVITESYIRHIVRETLNRYLQL